MSLGVDGIISLTRDPTSSRILDVLLTSPSTTPLQRRAFLLSLIGHYHTIADDRLGSRIAERCWESADVFLKEKIAASLVEVQVEMQKSAWAHFFARKLELPLYQRRREDWKKKMAAGGTKRVVAEVKVVENGGSKEKKRERVKDEVDEIFSAKKARKGVSLLEGEVETVSRPKTRAMPGLEDVFGAIKASAQ
jgi:nucleolar protein 9